MDGYYLGTVKAPSSEEARERIAKLAAYVRENFETKYDPEEARNLALAPSAYRYRKLDEKAVLEYERQLNGLSEPKPEASTTANELRRLRNQRYYEKRKAQLKGSTAS